MRNIQLSLCMIVKDEDANLGSCLECVRALVDEIIVVDTGSTDRTMEGDPIIGDLRTQSLENIWNSDSSRLYRENIKSKLDPCMNCNMQVVTE